MTKGVKQRFLCNSPLLEFYKKKPDNILQTQQYNVYRNPLRQHF